MPNQSGAWPKQGAFQAGRELSAAQLQRVVDALASRIVGDGKTIKVRTFPNGQICIEGTPGGGGLGTVTYTGPKAVPKLPPIPESGMLEVYWYGSPPPEGTPQPGTGDNQVWRAYAGQTRWTPTQKGTNYSGLPTP